MSYLVLARKWRPQVFEDVIGQQAVVRTLQNGLARDRVAHAMLFSGVRGVGKTTLARIMAKALNCHAGPCKTPCNHCESCREITAGSAIDLHEIDGASNRGIQEIRELKENIRFAPTKDRYKIFIIDEVHMLTTEAFNALLKTLEEPPAHVFFMFATTELHKIPITILSRCQRYELKRVAAGELTAFFKKIAADEHVVISDRALELVVMEAAGSVRDGLSLLDQVFSFAVGDEDGHGFEVKDDDVTQVLGLVDRQVLAQLAGAVLAGEPDKGLRLLDAVCGTGMDLKRFTNDLLNYFRALLVCKLTAAPEKLLELSDQELVAVREIAAGYSIETLQQYFQLLLRSIEEMNYSANPRLVLEMALIKAMQVGTIVPVTDLLARLDAILQQVGGADSSGTSAAEVVAAGDIASLATLSPGKEDTGSVLPPSPVGQESVVRGAGVDESAGQASPGGVGTPLPTAPQTAEPEPELPPAQKDIRPHWDEFIIYVMDRKRWMAHALQLASGARYDDGALLLKYDDPSDCKMLQTPDNLKILTEFAQDFFQRELKVRFRLLGGEDATDGVTGNTTPQEERRSLANDPLVQMATEILDGQVGSIRTGPRSR